MRTPKQVYVLLLKGDPVEDFYSEGYTAGYFTRTEALEQRFEIAALLGVNTKDIEIKKYVLDK